MTDFSLRSISFFFQVRMTCTFVLVQEQKVLLGVGDFLQVGFDDVVLVQEQGDIMKE